VRPCAAHRSAAPSAAGGEQRTRAPAGQSGPVLISAGLAPEFGEGVEILDLVRVGADGSPHWTRIWPTAEENPRHARLELWMANYGYQIVSRPASWFDSREGEDG
jgi:hypothetical protein